jgi:hypothetical protein
MILVWKNIKSFNHYFEFFDAHQQSHATDDHKQVKDMPRQIDIEYRDGYGDVSHLYGTWELIFTVSLDKRILLSYIQN